ncbi:hypothetical protein J6590_089990 [Homalodisca vitripennis]|nr:hypothetical protein J6590_089990 [Homalodisca vitripennis]
MSITNPTCRYMGLKGLIDRLVYCRGACLLLPKGHMTQCSMPFLMGYQQEAPLTTGLTNLEISRTLISRTMRIFRAWLLLGWVTAERSCPCKQPACLTIGGDSEVTFKPLVPRLSVIEGFLALTSPVVSAMQSYTDLSPVRVVTTGTSR